MFSRVHQVAVRVLCALLLITTAFAFAQGDVDQPLTPLSERLKSIISNQGAAAADSWFKDNWAVSKDQYAVDPDALIALMSDYLNAGDSISAQVVGEITASVMQDALAGEMQVNTPEMLEELNAQQQADAKKRALIDLREPDQG